MFVKINRLTFKSFRPSRISNKKRFQNKNPIHFNWIKNKQNSTGKYPSSLWNSTLTRWNLRSLSTWTNNFDQKSPSICQTKRNSGQKILVLSSNLCLFLIWKILLWFSHSKVTPQPKLKPQHVTFNLVLGKKESSQC